MERGSVEQTWSKPVEVAEDTNSETLEVGVSEADTTVETQPTGEVDLVFAQALGGRAAQESQGATAAGNHNRRVKAFNSATEF